MAGRGPAPKDPSKRARRNKPADTLDLEAGSKVKKPPELPNAASYLPATLAWYHTWCESEQATQFSSTDWQRLHMLAPLVDDYFEDPSKDLLSEIRQNEKLLGATPEDRQRLKWRIVGDAEDAPKSRKRSSRQRKDPRHLKAV